MQFDFIHRNRLHFPDRCVMICEDDLMHQVQLMHLMNNIFPRQGKTDIVQLPSGLMAAQCLAVMERVEVMDVKLVILDHDMPIGNGSNLLDWMYENKIKVPVMTASGIADNNDHMLQKCKELEIECIHTDKFRIIRGDHNRDINGLVMNR